MEREDFKIYITKVQNIALSPRNWKKMKSTNLSSLVEKEVFAVISDSTFSQESNHGSCKDLNKVLNKNSKYIY